MLHKILFAQKIDTVAVRGFLAPMGIDHFGDPLSPSLQLPSPPLLLEVRALEVGPLNLA